MKVNKLNGVNETRTSTMNREPAFGPSASTSCQYGRPQFGFVEKLAFAMSTFTMVFLFHAAIWEQWILPEFYLLATPVFMVINVTFKWSRNDQLFLIDFCYVVVYGLYIFLCTSSTNGDMFQVVFAGANGPLLMSWVIWDFRLVYHSMEDYIGLYIHLLPALVTFSMRWYPDSKSYLFNPVEINCFTYDPMLLYVVPLCVLITHCIVYCIVINVIVRPSSKYMTSYSHFTNKFKHLTFMTNPISECIFYNVFMYTCCILALLTPLLVYRYFYVHCAFLSMYFIMIVWNGAVFYENELNSLSNLKAKH